MPNKIIWPTSKRLIRANRLIVALTGEPFQVRDKGLLESAVAAPANLHHYEGETNEIRLAVRLIRSVGRNHPFAQGNKRTAFNGGVAFLLANKVSVDLPDTDGVAQMVAALITGNISEDDLSAYFTRHCEAAPSES